jgi:FkbM family methyltransferase
VEVRAAVRADGFIDITLTYFSVHETVNIGAFRDSAVYPGSSTDQFLIARVELSVQRPPTRLGGDRLVFVDVGAEGGWQEKWRRLAPDLDMTFVEPAPETAQSLRADYPNCRVLEVGLLDRSCARTLNITRLTGCSSLLLPDAELLRRWAVAPLFDVVRTVEVRCERYDALHAAGAAPRPDALKIDVQGVEYEVLQGFGELLFGCLGIELEAHFYPIYRGEKLLHEIVSYLSEYGLTLRRLEPQMSFDGDLVEANVYFTRRLDAGAPESARRKLALIEEVWELALHQVGPDLVRSVGLEPRIGGAA